MFERVVAALFGAGQRAADGAAERELVADMIEGVVDVVEPRLRMESSYRRKLEPCIRATIAHLRAIGREQPEPAWGRAASCAPSSRPQRTASGRRPTRCSA